MDNAPYLPYLQECGAFTDELAAHTAFTSPVLTQELQASPVRQLGLGAQPYINPRPAMYAFHDFRVCFIDHGSMLDASLVQCLLWLTGSEVANGRFEHVEGVQHGSVEIASTGWSTVLRTDMRTTGAEVTEIVSLLSLVRAQWYICQLWINVYDQDFKALDSTDPAVRVHDVRSGGQLGNVTLDGCLRLGRVSASRCTGAGAG